MPRYQDSMSKQAILAGAMLALGIQKMNMMPEKLFEEVYDKVTDSLNELGIDIQFDEIKSINKMPVESALALVKRVKTKIENAIEKTCGNIVSSWFELSFSLNLVGTAPESIHYCRDDLTKLANRVGFNRGAFENILDELKQGNEDVLSTFTEVAFEQIGRPCIFISYATNDRELAMEISSQFSTLGVQAFVANIDILAGTNWMEEILTEITRADEILLILSPDSHNRNWVMLEVGAAWALGKRITPALLYGDVSSLPDPIRAFQAQKIVTVQDRQRLIRIVVDRLWKSFSLEAADLGDRKEVSNTL